MLLIQSGIPTYSLSSKLVRCKVESHILFSPARWVEKLLLKLVVDGFVKLFLCLRPIIHSLFYAFNCLTRLRKDLVRFRAAIFQFPLRTIVVEQDLADIPRIDRLSTLVLGGHPNQLSALNNFLLRPFFFQQLFLFYGDMFYLKVLFANRRLVKGVYTVATTLIVGGAW